MKEQGSPRCDPWSSDFIHVLHAELRLFGEIEDAEPGRPEPGKPETVIARAHDRRLAGLAFSGGGIRSATFNLGVLQALADMDLLRKFHYLSTVSGGGYIGSWLIAWIHRRGGKMDDVARGLRTAWNKQPGGSGPEEIRFLRRFSNYLTPKLGWLGADTWTLIAIYLRNVLLNMTALVAAMAFVLMLPRLLGVLLASIYAGPVLSVVAICFFLLLALSGFAIQGNISFLRRDVWAGDPLKPEEDDIKPAEDDIQPKEGDKVIKLYPLPDEASSSEFLADGQEFENFVLGVEFQLKSPTASATISIRVPSQGNGQGWDIQIGRRESDGKTDSANARATGDIGEQEARDAFPQSLGTNESDRMRIICAGRTCRVFLNDRLINVARARTSDSSKGRIKLSRSAGEADIVKSILLRPIAETNSWITRQGSGVQVLAVLPLLLAAGLSVRLVGRPDSSWLFQSHQWWCWGVLAVVVMMLAHLAQFRFFDSKEKKTRATEKKTLAKKKQTLVEKWKRFRPRIGSAVLWSFVFGIASAIAAAGFLGFHAALPGRNDAANFWPRLIWGPPAFIVAVSLALIIYVGLRGRDLPEELREWWSRFGAWLLIYTVLWIGLFGLALYSPPLLHWLSANFKTILSAVGFGWIATTISSLLAAKSPRSGRKDSSRWRDMIALIGPYIFIIGLLAGLAWGIDSAFAQSSAGPRAQAAAASSALHVGLTISGDERPPVEVKVSPRPDRGLTLGSAFTTHWNDMKAAHLDGNWDWSSNGTWLVRVGLRFNCLLIGLLLGTALIAAFLCLRVDINEFSMHMMYRNRLARCYLGASNTGLRHPHPFTGFDPNDDIDLADLRQPQWRKEKNGPYPLINCSLNLVGGEELAWQQRMAAPFVFTPEYCGYDFPDLPPGYCQTGPDPEKPGRVYAASRRPLTLATAMSISGAAVSPNMGVFSSPATAFLMTLFNVRLGWWIGNPRDEKGWLRSSPNWALPWLLAEMFGFTNARGAYIYLSDGGHFENLGILELVRRRCRFIVACDAEDDHNFEFGGLGNAIEKCRTDLGVDIELDVEPIRCRDEQGQSRWHCAIGRIRYDQSDANAHAGTLLYIKSSLTGDESTDVLRYAARNRAFPHETTADQWFGESQFESYRALGYHAATSAFAAVDEIENLSILTTERLFVELAQRWYPPSSAIDPAFKRRGETLNALYETLRTEPNLRFLNQQVYSEWRVLVDGVGALPEPPRSWLPETYSEMRAGFYFCNRMIQLMEDVYHDLHLEQEYAHPDNRGWMNLFKHWAWSRMFRVTWTVCAANSGARFQNFCERHLGLKVGKLAVSDPIKTMDMIQNFRPEESPITSLEWQLLGAFLKQYRDLGDDKTQLRLLQIAPDDPSDKRQPSFSAGFVLLRAIIDDQGKTVPKILYFRIRDHLRRMGMARRGIYQLLYDNMKDQYLYPDQNLGTIDLALRSMPDTASEVDDENSRRVFKDLYRGVRLELDGRRLNTAEARIVISFKGSLRDLWLEKNENAEWYDEEIRSSLSKLGPDADEAKPNLLHGKWRDASGAESFVKVNVRTLFVWTLVAVEHSFLPNRARRDDMRKVWQAALSRLSLQVSEHSVSESNAAGQDAPAISAPSVNA